eukprot:1808416-Alexandrium_andersonii.AAC.1
MPSRPSTASSSASAAPTAGAPRQQGPQARVLAKAPHPARREDAPPLRARVVSGHSQMRLETCRFASDPERFQNATETFQDAVHSRNFAPPRGG